MVGGPRRRALGAAALVLSAVTLLLGPGAAAGYAAGAPAGAPAGVAGGASAHLVGEPAVAAQPGTVADPGVPASAPTADPGSTDLTLTSVSPAVVQPGQDLVVTGSLRNGTSSPLPRPTVQVVLGDTPVEQSRERVQEWASATGPARGTVVGQTRLGGTLAPGASSGFRVVVSKLASRATGSTYGALPLSVESGSASVRTFAGYQRLKQYQPLSVAWAVPLTLDPDPDLFAAEGQPREDAWQRALGDGSRLSRVLDATQDTTVTWAVDPTLTPSLLQGQHDVATGADAAGERALRSATEGRITSGAQRHSPWVLPDTDADLAAVVGTPSGDSLMRGYVARSAPVARALGGRSDVAWPVDGAYTTSREGALRRVYQGPALAGQVISSSVLGGDATTSTPVAAQRSVSGLPLLAYDDELSSLLARTRSPQEGVLSAQQFVADTAALLNELPGTENRTVLVVAPRSWGPDPATARAFFTTAAAIPWLTPTTTDAELAQARHATPSPAAPVTRPTEPFPGGRPVLTADRVAALERIVRTVQGVATIRDDGDQFGRTWSRAAEQLASTRWRAAPTAWSTLEGRVDRAAAQTTSAVKVLAGTINFLAESGRLQITVTNDLPVPVDNVRLEVEASNPRLRIDSQPPILRIGPRSRATVSVGVTALAAGPVPLRTTLTAPDGTVIGQGAEVQVRVTPTGDWVYWVLGGLAGLILLAGLARTFLRRPRRRPTSPTTPEVPR
ncbi:DUF6049 family protein [Pedococcus sp. NPDC057267]|uniref:DUF6049 family protein n=1 Tax=Pedococcus sp. NPDC057267 TaxID=3346077 RepID=UPI0036314FCF